LHYIPTNHQLVFSDAYQIIFYSLLESRIVFVLPLEGRIVLTVIRSDSTEDSDPRYLFTLANENNFIYIYDLAIKAVHRILKGHSAQILSLIYIPKTTMIATSGNDKNIMIWDYSSTKPKMTLEGHTRPVICLCTTREHNKLISGSKDCTIKIWY
jgi:FOG: WD40 repeat